jgi:hypothetical protein
VTTRADKIKREKIIQRYFATGPDDKGAAANYIPNVGVLPFAMKRDLAIFELRRSLPHHYGLTFSLDELQVGQEVDIYGYTKGMTNPIRKLTRFPAIFKAPTTSGLLAFDYQLSADKPIRISVAGASDKEVESICVFAHCFSEILRQLSLAPLAPPDTFFNLSFTDLCALVKSSSEQSSFSNTTAEVCLIGLAAHFEAF